MINLYPLLLKPAVKDYLWGGTKLKTEFGFESDTEIAAEGWMLSCHKDGASTVLNGEYKGKTLAEVVALWGNAALGKNAEKFPYFPLLIKLIDAKQSLSVQVHPDDSYALSNEGEFGKTEMWYVVDCEPGAKLIYGFSKNISTEEFESRIKDNTLTEVCNFVPVKKGDLFFIGAGTLHAIGEGILIAEVQQNSNTTYRVSDYGRLGADGKPRPLHIDKAIAVTKCEKPTEPYGQVGRVTKIGQNSFRQLAQCKFFTAGLIGLADKYTVCAEDSFVSLLVLEGEAVIIWEKEVIKLKKGDSLFVPAGLSVTLNGQAEILYSCV